MWNKKLPGSRGIVEGSRITIAGVLKNLAIISLYISTEVAANNVAQKVLRVEVSYMVLDIKLPINTIQILSFGKFNMAQNPSVPIMQKTILNTKYNHHTKA